MEHWQGDARELGVRVLSRFNSGFVARDSRRQRGVTIGVRRQRNARSHVGHEQRCAHIHEGLVSVEPRAQCQRILLGRRSSGNRGRWQKRAEGCQDWNFRTRQRQEHERKERKKSQRARESQKGHHVSSFVTSPGNWAGDCPCHGNSSHSLGCSGFAWASMFIEVKMSLGFTFFLMASLLSDRFSGFGMWDSGATTSMSGFTSAMEDSFWINITPGKQVSCTFANGESQTSNSRVTFSITSQIPVGLHFSCFWTHSCVWMLCELWAGYPMRWRGKAYSRRLQVYLPTTTLPVGHVAWDVRKSSSMPPGEMDGPSSGPEQTVDVHHLCSSSTSS